MNKKILILLNLCMLATLFSGCGQNNDSEISEEYIETDMSESGLAEKLEMTDSDYKVEVYNTCGFDFNFYSMNADVVIPDTDSMGVYSLESVEIDESYAKETAKTIFDDGEYEDISSRNLNDVEKRERIDELDKVLFDEDEEHSVIDYYIEADTSSALSDYAYKYAADYLYEGSINGNRALIGMKGNLENDGSQIYIATDADYDESYSLMTLERAEELNLNTISCTYTVEEAQEIAKRYIEKLGLYNYGLLRYVYKMVQNDEGILTPSGYVFYYGLSVNGATALFDEYGELDNEIVNENIINAYKGQITVCVDSSGLSFLEANPYTISGTDTSDAELLTFSQIYEAIINILDNEGMNNYEYYSSMKVTTEAIYYIGKIELGYYITEDETSCKILIPAWAYYEEYGDCYIRKLQNAINGEEITDNLTIEEDEEEYEEE